MPDVIIDLFLDSLLANDQKAASELLNKIKGNIDDKITQQGFCVLKNNRSFSPSLFKEYYWALFQELFTPVAQNKNNVFVSDVLYDKGYLEKVNYRHSNEGFNFHTDGVYLEDTIPEVIGLACIKQSVKGGESVLINGDELLCELKKNEACFGILSQKEFYVTSNESVSGKSMVNKKIIELDREGSLVRINYFRKTIESAYGNTSLLSSEEKMALSFFDVTAFKLMNNIKFKLEPGDFLLVNNHKMLHGRLPFTGESGERHLLRMWGDFK